MTIQEAITKAVEGGWNAGTNWLAARSASPLPIIDVECQDNMQIVRLVHENYGNGGSKYTTMGLQVALLDPLFWQALGKSIGWNIQEKQYSDPKNPTGHTRDYLISGWQYQMHRLIDHLAEGKSIESFFESLNKRQ